MLDLYAFIRPKECRFLKVGAFDFQNNTITVDKLFSKNKKTQTVAILPQLRKILLDYLGATTLNPDDYLLSKTGVPGSLQISSKHVLTHHHRLMRSLGIDEKKFKPYSWKHTGNATAYINGASLKFLKLQNRHSRTDTTEIYLSSIVPEDLVSGEEQFFDF